ncbi:uncharacterized protein LOC103575912 [Microplitis demolitor]|uniref:uncharacterized protein LOC103575912 n=1 Tax=Microplitis demolitor TaxID=69319 RepID=UPI0004CD72A9|nr:uncharacterized protein LOC103575912 [Microplitis demolitor]
MDDNDRSKPQCENILFELCSLRERYPSKCANIFEDCLHITNDINMKPLKSTRTQVQHTSLIEPHETIIGDIFSTRKEQKKNSNFARTIPIEVENLKILFNQIKTTESLI